MGKYEDWCEVFLNSKCCIYGEEDQGRKKQKDAEGDVGPCLGITTILKDVSQLSVAMHNNRVGN